MVDAAVVKARLPFTMAQVGDFAAIVAKLRALALGQVAQGGAP